MGIHSAGITRVNAFKFSAKLQAERAKEVAEKRREFESRSRSRSPSCDLVVSPKPRSHRSYPVVSPKPCSYRSSGDQDRSHKLLAGRLNRPDRGRGRGSTRDHKDERACSSKDERACSRMDRRSRL